jgi:hypothetical protein
VKWCRANPKQATYGTADAFKAGLARLSVDAVSLA